jgi:hypothetical protein
VHVLQFDDAQRLERQWVLRVRDGGYQVCVRRQISENTVRFGAGRGDMDGETFGKSTTRSSIWRMRQTTGTYSTVGPLYVHKDY